MGREFGISGPLLDWIKSYFKERQQFTIIVNGSTSEMLPVSFKILQGSVLRETLFTLFKNDIPSQWHPAESVFMFADDKTIYCTSDTAEKFIALLNTAFLELNEWCLVKSNTLPK